MKPHTDYPQLDGLDELVHQQRRKVAAKMRIKDEDRQLTDRIAAQLQAAGAEAVTVTIGLGTFVVSLATSQAGKVYATVTKIGEPPPAEA